MWSLLEELHESVAIHSLSVPQNGSRAGCNLNIGRHCLDERDYRQSAVALCTQINPMSSTVWHSLWCTQLRLTDILYPTELECTHG